MEENQNVFEDTVTETESVFTPTEEDKIPVPVSVASNTAAMGSFVLGKDLNKDYYDIRSEILTSGKSNKIQDIQDIVSQREFALDKQVASDILTDPGLSTQAKSNQILDLQAMRGERGEEPLYLTFTKDIINLYNSDLPAVAEQQQERAAELVEEDNSLKLAIDWIKPKAVNLENSGNVLLPGFEAKDVPIFGKVFKALGVGDASFLDFWGDVADLSIPFSHWNKTSDLYVHMMGKDAPILTKMFTGELYHEMADTFTDLSPEKKVEWAEKMTTYIHSQEGWVKDHNSFEAQVTVDSLLNVDRTKEDFDWDRLIENLLVPLDALSVGGYARVLGKTFGSVLDVLTRYNPVKAEEVAVARIMTKVGSETTEAVGSTSIDIIADSHLPGRGEGDGVLNGAPTNILTRVVERSEESADILGRYQVSNPTKRRLIKELSEENSGGILHVNKTWVRTDPDTGISIVHSMVGATSARGYSTSAGAYSAAQRRGVEVARLWVRNKKGEIVKTNQDNIKAKGEFFYEAIGTVQTNANDVVDFTKVKPLNIAGKPQISKYFRDVNGLWGPEDSLKLGAMDDFAAAVKDKVRRIDRDLANKKLSIEDKNASVRLLARGAQEGRVIPYEEAIAGTDVYNPVSPKAYDSYLAKRVQSDLTYSVANHRLLEDLKNKGYNLLDESDGEFTFGRKLVGDAIIREALSPVKEVLDAGTGKPIALTEEMRHAILIRKGQVFKLRSAERIDDSEFNFMYVSPDNVRMIKDLPKEPLRYIDGYVYRKHLDRYFIEVTSKVTVDGNLTKVDRSTVRGAADNARDAASKVKQIEEELGASLNGLTVSFRLGREMVRGLSDTEASYEMAKATGLIHRGRRGPLLDKKGGDLENVLSVHEALQNSIAQASDFLSKTPLVDSLESQFATFFGEDIAREFGKEILPINNDGIYVFPNSSKSLVDPGPTNPELKKVYNQAVAAWDYINMVGRYQDPVTKVWRASMLKLGMGLDKLTNGRIGLGLGETLGKKDPLDVLRSTAFIQFLALNPLRQLPLQASQHLVLAPLAPTYVATGRASKDAITTLLGGMARHDPDLWRRISPIQAKIRGLSLEDYTKEVDMWLETGMSQSLTSHQMLNAMLPNAVDVTGRSQLATIASQSKNALLFPLRMSQNLGFNAGELLNLAATWHTLRFKAIKDGNKISALDLGRQARQLSLSMTKAGSLGYQEGWGKLTGQFQSFQHKQTAAMLGENPSLNRQQRATILLTQAATFGAKGIGLGSVGLWLIDKYQEVFNKEIPEETKQKYLEGVGSFYVNQGLNTAAEVIGLKPEDYEGSFVSFTSFAPLSGSTYATGTIFDLAFGPKTLFDAMIGPGGVALGKASKTLGQVFSLFNAVDPEGDKDGIKTALKALDILSRGLSSGISNYHKGRIAEEVGFFIDKQQDITVKARLLEAWAKGSMGLGSYDEWVYRQRKNDVFESKKEERELAKRAVSTMMHLYDARHNIDSTDTLVTKMEEILVVTKFAGEEYNSRFRELFMREYLHKVETRNGQSDLFQEMMRRVDTELGEDAIYSNLLELVPAGKERENWRKVLDATFKAESQSDMFKQSAIDDVFNESNGLLVEPKDKQEKK